MKVLSCIQRSSTDKKSTHRKSPGKKAPGYAFQYLLTTFTLLGSSLLCPLQAFEQAPFAYGEALQKSLYFYEAQQAGPLPDWNRVQWRADSTPHDIAADGSDLRGGWFDAGDHVKFGFPMAGATTMLAWGGVDYSQAYRDAGQLDELLNNLRFVNDYFISAHPSANVLYGQVGTGSEDHAKWVSPEVIHLSTPVRAIAKIDTSCPGTDLAAETAAAMAASSMVFAGEDPAYAATLLSHAKDLFNFADTTKGSDGKDTRYTLCIPDAAGYYDANYGVYWDELAWAAAWLYRATGENRYLTKVDEFYPKMGIDGPTGNPVSTWTQSWNDKAYGVYALMAKITNTPKYHNDTRRWLNHWSTGSGRRSNAGLMVVDRWGVLRYAANTAYISLFYADLLPNSSPLKTQYHDFAKRQIDYTLGDNPRNSSYVVGFGENPPLNVHHKGAHGAWANNLKGKPENNRHILYGALVGGPTDDLTYDPNDRGDYVKNEVATDYNAGFTSALAALYEHHGGAPLHDSQFPPQMQADEEFYVTAKMHNQNSRALEINLQVHNHSAFPARVTDKLSIRYFVDLSEVFAAGYQLSDLSVSSYYNSPATFSQLIPWGDPDKHLYYVSINFTGIKIYPGGEAQKKEEMQIRVGLDNSSNTVAWDNSNDPSFDSSYLSADSQGIKTAKIPVYSNNHLLNGVEPPACGAGTNINCLPVAIEQQVTTAFNTRITFDLSGSDSDGTISAYQLVTTPEHGSLTLQGGKVSYQPERGFSGSDEFTFTVTDNSNGISVPAKVTIEVEALVVPEVSILHPGDGASFTTEQAIVIQYRVTPGFGISLDLDGVGFHQDTAPGTYTLPAISQPGDYHLTATLLDNEDDQLNTSQSITLHVVPPQAVVTITSPAANSRVKVGEQVIVNYELAHAAGVNLYRNGVLLGYFEQTSIPVSAGQLVGNMQLELVAVDENGQELEGGDNITLKVVAAGSGLNCTMTDNHWGSGYVLYITLSNTTDDTITDWSVNLDFNQPPQISNHWGAEFSSSGNQVTITPKTYNNALPPGAELTLGVQGSYSGDFVLPSCQ